MDSHASGQQLPKIPPSMLVLPEVTPATRLLERRRQQFEADEALDAAKHQYAMQEVTFKQREEALKKRDQELQESLLRFTRFLQENDFKRAKANRKESDEAALRQEKEAEIERLHAEMDTCQQQKQSMQQTLLKVVRYQQYLQSVVEAGETFQEVDDILARCATLQSANGDLRQQQAACRAEAERLVDATAQAAKAKSSLLLDLNNRLSLSKKELEVVQAEVAFLEAQQENGQHVAALRMLELGQVAAATANVYQRCLQRSKVAHAADECDSLLQLDAVAHHVGDLMAALAQQPAQLSAAVPGATG